MKEELQEILKIESKISELSLLRDKLGLEYVNENFKFKKNDLVTILDSKNKESNGKIVKLWFDSHSRIQGLVKFIIRPINKDGKVIENRYGICFGDESIKSINYFEL